MSYVLGERVKFSLLAGSVSGSGTSTGNPSRGARVGVQGTDGRVRPVGQHKRVQFHDARHLILMVSSTCKSSNIVAVKSRLAIQSSCIIFFHD